VLKDDKKAVYWYQKAADQGQAQTQFNLGVKYAFGKGVLKDDKQAVYSLIGCFLIPIHGLFIIF
jgi:TPR repeat protein